MEIRLNSLESSEVSASELQTVLLDSLPCVAMVVRRHTREVIACNALARRMGAEPGRSCFQSLQGRSEPCDFCLAPKLWETSSEQHAAVQIKGRVFDISWIPFTEDLYVHYLFDVTEQRKSADRFRAIVETAPVGIIAADPNTGNFMYVNPEICGMLGRNHDEMIKLSIMDIHPVEELPLIKKTFEAREPARTACLRKDGTSFPVEITSVTVDLDGKDSLVGFFTDMTSRLLLEEERLKTQKLESIGTLAGGIAHDFNNLLQGIFGYISMARLNLSNPAKAADMLDNAEYAVHKAGNLSTQLLTFSKGGKPIKARLNLETFVEDIVRFCLSGSNTAYKIRMEEPLMPVWADRGQIEQVFRNILLNAEQAMNEGGTVTVELSNVRVDPGSAEEGLKPGKYVVISISDTGSGIPKENISRIFDPYFSTKEKGSGLGLSAVYSILSNHDGVIRVSSRVGEGSVFKFYLPASYVNRPSFSAESLNAESRQAKVLIMDDEYMVRHIAAELLMVMGHKPDTCSDGEEAIRKYIRAAEAGEPFDLVILDLTIRGGMGGAEALKRLREFDPEANVIISSGYTEDESMPESLKRGSAIFLKKPYTVERLKETLSKALF